MRFLLAVVIMFVSLSASVDINSASKKELITLKGIGEVKATAIIEFRKNHCFKTVEELTLVKGIGKKTVAKNDLTAGKCTH